jgi:hypothetical protein
MQLLLSSRSQVLLLVVVRCPQQTGCNPTSRQGQQPHPQQQLQRVPAQPP